jgi:hypothetical protein
VLAIYPSPSDLSPGAVARDEEKTAAVRPRQ